MCSTRLSVISTKFHRIVFINLQTFSSAMEAEMSRSLQAAKIDSSSRHSQQAALLRLPLEIRQKIYAHALVHTMSPSPEKIYFAEEPITSLPPASLYFVNRQIHVELRAAFAKIKGPLILHITPQGAFYSSFQRPRSLPEDPGISLGRQKLSPPSGHLIQIDR